MNNSVRAKKYLGQHFLKDESIAKRIADAYLLAVPPSTLPNLLEIGPGMGVLTKYLIADSTSLGPGTNDTNFETLSSDVIAKATVCDETERLVPGTNRINLKVIEIDVESVVFLEEKYPRLKVIEGDFLHYPLDSIFEEKFGIIGNFPYNISSQILFRTLENKNRIPCLVGMFQKEVAMRIAANPGSKTYGILSVLLQAFYNIEYLFTVPPTVFNPPPQVESGVIRLQRNQTEALDCDEKFFVTVVKTAFNQRRKTLRNALKPLLNQEKNITTGSIFDKRAEQLSVQDFIEITKLISS